MRNFNLKNNECLNIPAGESINTIAYKRGPREKTFSAINSLRQIVLLKCCYPIPIEELLPATFVVWGANGSSCVNTVPAVVLS